MIIVEEMSAKDCSFSIRRSRMILATGATMFFITDILYAKII